MILRRFFYGCRRMGSTTPYLSTRLVEAGKAFLTADTITRIQQARYGHRNIHSGGPPIKGRLTRLVANLGEIPTVAI